jgi:hypothetical protein
MGFLGEKTIKCKFRKFARINNKAKKLKNYYIIKRSNTKRTEKKTQNIKFKKLKKMDKNSPLVVESS